jgi:deoxyhypusine synthase
MKRYTPADLNNMKTFPIEERPTKVDSSELAKVSRPGVGLEAFLESLPHILKADELRGVVQAMVSAHRNDKAVVVGIGAHVVKCGLAPLLIDFMERGIISAIAMNGGASIHDFEMALIGRTSEDVAASLEHGRFGMVRETGEAMNGAISEGAACGTGMGASLGRKLLELDAPFKNNSILASGARLGVPVTVHIAVGGDTIHMHPSADGAALGQASFTDFRLLISVLQDVGDGGVYLNVGSAVVLPEVFVKALNAARNLSQEPVTNFTTANMDMNQHYRPIVNVLNRPTMNGGSAYSLTGHHEIMLPLLFALVTESLA